MKEGTFNPSRCDIRKAEIIPSGSKGGKPTDIALMCGDFRISQGIQNVSLFGSIDVYDGIGLLENLPLRGEEELDLQLYCYDLQTEVNLKCQIYKIDNVDVRKNIKAVSYTLHWITAISYKAGKRSFIKAYTKKASTIVKDIFQTYYDTGISQIDTPKDVPDNTNVYNISDGRRLYIEKTDDIMQVTIPDLMPSQAIGFISLRTFGSTKSKSSLFRWFENIDGFFFVSDEWLYEYGRKKTNKEMHYRPFVNLDGAQPLEQIDELTTMSNPNRVDTAAELLGGAYYNTVVEVDILRRTADRHSWSYLDYYKDFVAVNGEKATIAADIHSEDFIKSTFTEENAKQFMIIRDYRKDFNFVETFKPEMHLRDLASKRNMFAWHASATQVGATTAGRLDLRAGEVITVKLREVDAGEQPNQHKQLSGKYLIVALDSTVADGQLSTSMALYKYGWSDGGNDTRVKT